jgi:hypothetical protein
MVGFWVPLAGMLIGLAGRPKLILAIVPAPPGTMFFGPQQPYHKHALRVRVSQPFSLRTRIVSANGDSQGACPKLSVLTLPWQKSGGSEKCAYYPGAKKPRTNEALRQDFIPYCLRETVLYDERVRRERDGMKSNTILAEIDVLLFTI